MKRLMIVAGVLALGLVVALVRSGSHAERQGVERLAEAHTPQSSYTGQPTEVFHADLGAARAVGDIGRFEANASLVRAHLLNGQPSIDFPIPPIDAAEVDEIAVGMWIESGKARPILSWIIEGEREPSVGAAVNIPWIFDGRDRREVVSVSRSPLWHGQIRALRLVPTDTSGDVRVSSVVGLRLPQPTNGRARVSVGPESRDAIIASSSSTFEYEVTPDQGARLDFGIGIPDEAWSRLHGPVTFAVSVNGTERFQRALNPSEHDDDQRWVDASLDLSDCSGKRTRLQLEVRFAAGESFPRAAFGSPIVSSPQKNAYMKRGGSRVQHVVLISLDTLRADHLGCYGYPRQTSPRMDDFARHGVRFASAIANAPETLESHMTMFTSLLPSAHGVSDVTHRLSDRVPTLATALSAAGFLTAAFVGNGYLASSFGFDHGFDRYDDGVNRPDNLKVDSARTFGKAREFIRSNKDRPTFTFVHTYEIHTPYAPPPDALAEFDDPHYSGKVGNVLPFFPDAVKLFGSGPPSSSDLAHVVALYDAGIRQADRLVGELLDAIAKDGLDDDTLVVLVSDHGEELMEHGTLANHGHSLYDELLRVPIILRGPGLPAGSAVNGDVSLIDLAPTLLEYLDVPTPRTFQGVSLLEAVRDGRRRNGIVISEDLTVFRRASVRRETTKYIRTRNIERDRMTNLLQSYPEFRSTLEPIYARFVRELYFDLVSDPGEKSNIASLRKSDCDSDYRLLDAALSTAREIRVGLGGPTSAGSSSDLSDRLHALGYLSSSRASVSVSDEIADERREDPDDR
ncbi:MAG: sulfatase [Planctomycetes bacterium]|nr:sulfatase [Planctomycetota bacterium]MBI3848300.1 sulfatase [Planctomycetota bacterium]